MGKWIIRQAAKRARRSAKQVRQTREAERDRARAEREAGREKARCHWAPAVMHRVCPDIAGWSRIQLRSYLWQAWEGRCHYCGCETYLFSPGMNAATIDHATPKSRGGPHALVNLVLACYRCNNLKGQLTAGEFFAFNLDRSLMGEAR